MSIGSRYLHTLTVKRNVATGALDDYGQPVTAETTVATVRGLVQPRRAREVALASQAGVVLGEHAGYIDPMPSLTTADWLELDGVRYDVLAIYDAGGVGHHYELGLQRVS